MVTQLFDVKMSTKLQCVKENYYLFSKGKTTFETLQWRHNGRNGVSNHQPHDCFFNRYRISKKTLKLRVTGLCAGNSPVTGEFPAQMASNVENISIWWRHHVEQSFKWISTIELDGFNDHSRLHITPCCVPNWEWHQEWEKYQPCIRSRQAFIQREATSMNLCDVYL